MIFILATISFIYILILMVLLIMRREMQPLKIKSPRLMLLSIFANLLIIMSVTVIQLTEEECVNKKNIDQSALCNHHILEVTSLCLGYVLIGFTEPLAVIAYVLRAFRLRRIFDAQLYYFREEHKPVAMIQNFREHRLMRVLAVSVGISVTIYLTTALCLMYVPAGDETKLYLPNAQMTTRKSSLRLFDL